MAPTVVIETGRYMALVPMYHRSSGFWLTRAPSTWCPAHDEHAYAQNSTWHADPTTLPTHQDPPCRAAVRVDRAERPAPGMRGKRARAVAVGTARRGVGRGLGQQTASNQRCAHGACGGGGERAQGRGATEYFRPVCDAMLTCVYTGVCGKRGAAPCPRISNMASHRATTGHGLYGPL